MADEPKKLGVVTHYYPTVSVGIVRLDDDLSLGTRLKFQGKTTDFEQEVSQMQFDHKDIEMGKKGQEVGVKLSGKVRNGDAVYLA